MLSQDIVILDYFNVLKIMNQTPLTGRDYLFLICI